jgi:hypothetical protein
MSDDEGVLQTYSEYENIFPIIQFDGFHDNVHNIRLFPELYASIRKSCRHYCFIDTDEYLALYEGGDRFETGTGILAFLDRNNHTPVFPGTWLQGVAGRPNCYSLGARMGTLSDGLKWGKPVISSAVDVSGIILHNTQNKRAMVANELRTNLFVLHQSNAVPEERINANLLKLKAQQVIKDEEGLPEVLALNYESKKIGGNYIREIHQLVLAMSAPASIDGSIEILADGTIRWTQDWQKTELQSFIAEPFKFCAGLFSD